MIETHIHPQTALSDREQQITPNELKQLLNQITFYSTTSNDPIFTSKLNILRQIIDEIDEDILYLIAKRFDIVTQIAHYKKEHKVAAFQLSRWKNILQSRKNLAKELQLRESFIHQLLSLLHEESINIQNQVLNTQPSDSKQPS